MPYMHSMILQENSRFYTHFFYHLLMQMRATSSFNIFNNFVLNVVKGIKSQNGYEADLKNRFIFGSRGFSNDFIQFFNSQNSRILLQKSVIKSNVIK